MHATRNCRMAMCIDEARQSGFATQIDLAAFSSGEVQDLIIRAHCEKSSATDGDSLCSRKPRIHGPEISVVENEIRLRLFQWKHSQSAQADDEVAPRNLEHRSLMTCWT